MNSRFITEAELAEIKKKRQDEWEKARNGNDPEEPPEEPYDNRPLYDRLKEQKMKKDLEYEEAHKLKNLIRGLDDDEVHFLDLIDQHKFENEKRQQIEVENELEDYRKQVAALQEKSISKENVNSKRSSKIVKTKSTQKFLLSGIIRKIPSTITKVNRMENTLLLESKSSSNSQKRKSEISKQTKDNKNFQNLEKGALRCVAILPGIGRYRESSDSEMSSGSEEEISNEKYDLCGRKKQKKCEDQE